MIEYFPWLADSSRKVICKAVSGIILTFIIFAIVVWLVEIGWGSLPQASAQSLTDSPTHIPTPTYDPLAIPTLPENPTQEELGRHVYYYNCMPCHGDHGQGLTEDWQQVWEEDHRDCWGRGCHGGAPNDEGFPLPTVIPAIILDDDALRRYTTRQDLFSYLQSTHPPQEPGRLDDQDYQALVAYLWVENNKPLVQATLELAPTQFVPPSPELSPTIHVEETGPGRSFSFCNSLGVLFLVLLVAGIFYTYRVSS